MLDRILNLIRLKGTNVKNIEQECGFANGSLKKINEKSECSRIYALAQYFNVSMEYLITGRKDPSTNKTLEFSEEDKDIIAKYHKLNETGRGKVYDYLSDLIDCGKYKKVACLDA